jgi:DNA-3-methyladenine glycosylase II
VVRAAYGLPEAAPHESYRAIAEHWRPLRSWVSFWLRAAGGYPRNR